MLTGTNVVTFFSLSLIHTDTKTKRICLLQVWPSPPGSQISETTSLSRARTNSQKWTRPSGNICFWTLQQHNAHCNCKPDNRSPLSQNWDRMAIAAAVYSHNKTCSTNNDLISLLRSLCVCVCACRRARVCVCARRLFACVIGFLKGLETTAASAPQKPLSRFIINHEGCIPVLQN